MAGQFGRLYRRSMTAHSWIQQISAVIDRRYSKSNCTATNQMFHRRQFQAGGIISAILASGRNTAMAKVLRCRDLGMDCPKEVRAESEDELLRLAAEHAERDHGISAAVIPPSILAMVKFAIRDE